jgi:Uma2 family endonuclease
MSAVSIALTKPTSVEAFLAREEHQELRWEIDGFAPVAVTGGNFAHAAIERNLITGLTNRLRGNSCHALGSDFKVMVADNIRYPDAMAFRRPMDAHARLIEDPVVVFETLSLSTALTDRIIKNRECRDTPSIRRYVLLEQDQPAATVFERKDSDWIGHLPVDATTLAMPGIGIEIPLADLYEDLSFEAPTATDI